MKGLVGFALVLLCSTNLLAQYPLTRKIEVRAGQRKPHIERMAQDPQGVLWLGSELGIQRTDGERTDMVRYTEGQVVTAMATDAAGVLAALSDGTILLCSGSHCDTLWKDPALSATPVRGVHRSVNGDLWLGTYGAGLWLVREGELTMITIAVGLRDDHINALCALADGRIAVATDQGVAICSSDGKVERTITEQDGLPDNLVLSLFGDDVGSLWAGTDRAGAVEIRPGKDG